MNDASPTFLQAATDLKDWASGLLETDVVIKPAGHPAQNGDVAISPWRMTRDIGDAAGAPQLMSALGSFCLSIGPDAPEAGCAWYDALFFAALACHAVALSADEPPGPYWSVSPGLVLTLSRRIRRERVIPRPAPVREPLVFDIAQNPSTPVRERT